MATPPDKTSDWKMVVNTKKIKRDVRIQARKRERTRWEAILKTWPHVVTPHRAERLRRRLNVDKLDTRLLSDEWIEHQKRGWKYVKTLKLRDPSEIPNVQGVEYSILDLDNTWGDKVLFSRSK